MNWTHKWCRFLFSKEKNSTFQQDACEPSLTLLFYISIEQQLHIKGVFPYGKNECGSFLPRRPRSERSLHSLLWDFWVQPSLSALRSRSRKLPHPTSPDTNTPLITHPPKTLFRQLCKRALTTMPLSRHIYGLCHKYVFW